MKATKKAALAAGLVLAVLAALAWWQRAAIGLHVMAREVAAIAAGADPVSGLPDGLHVALCGAGSPLLDERRDGPCTVVVAGKRMFLFDAGSGAARNILRMRLRVGQVDTLFLTHYHSDHIDGVGEVLLQRWVQRAASQPLPVYGPPGLQALLDGVGQSYASDRRYRIAHHGERVLPPSGFGSETRAFELPDDVKRRVLVSEPDLEVVAFAVEHDPVDAAVGYRVRYKDRTIVISGDTRRCDAMVREARNADLLLHEALSPAMVGLFEDGFAKAGSANFAKIMHDIPSYHTTPVEAAQIAQAAGVRMLVLHHIIPVLPRGLEPAFLQGTDTFYGGPIHVGVDGDWFSLPAGGKAIHVGRRP
jgi:ribonuclease Z